MGSAYSIGLIGAMLAAGKPEAEVCQARGVFRYVKSLDGLPMVCGRAVTGFASTEEQALGLTRVVPFLVADMLTRAGGHYSKAADWQPRVVTDGLLPTTFSQRCSDGLDARLSARTSPSEVVAVNAHG